MRRSPMSNSNLAGNRSLWTATSRSSTGKSSSSRSTPGKLRKRLSSSELFERKRTASSIWRGRSENSRTLTLTFIPDFSSGASLESGKRKAPRRYTISGLRVESFKKESTSNSGPLARRTHDIMVQPSRLQSEQALPASFPPRRNRSTPPRLELPAQYARLGLLPPVQLRHSAAQHPAAEISLRPALLE